MARVANRYLKGESAESMILLTRSLRSTRISRIGRGTRNTSSLANLLASQKMALIAVWRMPCEMRWPFVSTKFVLDSSVQEKTAAGDSFAICLIKKDKLMA